MPLPDNSKAVDLEKLQSPKVTDLILGLFNTGVKKISLSPATNSSSPDSGSGGGLSLPNIFGAFAGLIGGVVGFVSFAVSSILSVFSFAPTAIVAVVQQTTSFLWNFNWAATDQQLDAQLNSQLTALGAQLGGTIGNAVGFLLCGGVAGASLFAFNEALAIYVLRELGEEALEEFVGNAMALAYQASAFLVQSIFVRTYQSARSVFSAFTSSVGWAIELIGEITGSRSEGFQQYLKEREGVGQIVSFAEFFEEVIDSIPNQFSRAFFEEFFDEFGDACWESFYVIAAGIENFMAQQKTIRRSVLGQQKVIEVFPNRDIESESIILAGPEEILKPALVQTLTHYELVENRDFGQFVGSEVEEFIVANPLSLRSQLILYPHQQPPFTRPNNPRPRQVTLTIPDVDRSKLDWSLLKQACGGAGGYQWGRFVANARLNNGRSMQCWAASEEEAERQIERMLLITDAELTTLHISEQQRKGVVLSNPRLQKEPRQVFPGYVYIINREQLIEPGRGQNNTRQSNYRDRRERIPLYTDSAPDNFDEIVNDILAHGRVITD